MSNLPENIHDKGYRRILSNKTNFLNLLKDFVKASWVEEIKEDDIEIIDKSFVPKDFQEKESDLIYRLKFNETEAIFYCLIEFQSSVDYTIPFRLLKYMDELWTRIFMDADSKQREKKEFRLPAIIPCILYNGTAEWTAVRSFREYLNCPEKFGTELLNFEYIFLNVNKFDDEALMDIGTLISSVFMMDKKFDDKKFYDNLSKSFRTISKLTQSEQIQFMDWLKDVLIKKLKSDSIVQRQVEGLIDDLSKGDDVDMEYGVGRYFESIIQRIEEGKEEGINIGIGKGIQEGIQEGIQNEKKQTIFRLFDMKFPEEEIAKIVAYPLEMVVQIKKERSTN